MDKILDFIEVGKNEGAKLVTGGQRMGKDGFFVQPTIFQNVISEMKIAQAEVRFFLELILRKIYNIYEKSPESGILYNIVNYVFFRFLDQ